MIEIAEWQERYEVNSRGLEAKEGDELRVGPLKYVRLKVHGHQQGAGYRRMKAAAGKKTMQVFGIFCKFLEIAGNQPKALRGQLLDEHDQPATPEALAFILDIPAEQIKGAIKTLTNKAVGWLLDNTDNITQDNITQYNTIQGAGNSQKSPENPGKFIKPTDKEVTEYAKTIGYELDGERFCSHYESNGWKVGRNPMKSWKAAVKTWKSNNYGENNQTNRRKPKGGFDELPYAGKNDDLTIEC